METVNIGHPACIMSCCVSPFVRFGLLTDLQPLSLLLLSGNVTLRY